MRKHLNYVLENDGDMRTLFRFYPRRSSCHSFGDDPPKSWQEVYKVYYTWAILKQYRNNSSSPWETYKRLDISDECSAINEVAYICQKLADGIAEEINTMPGGEKYTIKFLSKPIRAAGYGADWTIRKEMDHSFGFTIRIRPSNFGYFFWLKQNELKPFGEFLQTCCDYMLAHGSPI